MGCLAHALRRDTVHQSWEVMMAREWMSWLVTLLPQSKREKQGGRGMKVGVSLNLTFTLLASLAGYKAPRIQLSPTQPHPRTGLQTCATRPKWVLGIGTEVLIFAQLVLCHWAIPSSLVLGQFGGYIPSQWLEWLTRIPKHKCIYTYMYYAHTHKERLQFNNVCINNVCHTGEKVPLPDIRTYLDRQFQIFRHWNMLLDFVANKTMNQINLISLYITPQQVPC